MGTIQKLRTPHGDRPIDICDTDTVEDFMKNVFVITGLLESHQHQGQIVVIAAGKMIVNYNSEEYADYKGRNFSKLCKDKTGWEINTLDMFNVLHLKTKKTEDTILKQKEFYHKLGLGSGIAGTVLLLSGGSVIAASYMMSNLHQSALYSSVGILGAGVLSFVVCIAASYQSKELKTHIQRLEQSTDQQEGLNKI